MSFGIVDLEKLRSKGARFLLTILKSSSDECIRYPYAKDTCGYGLVGGFGAGVSRRAHRIMFEVVQGHVPEVVMHSCDVPSCCNPKHLVAGTRDLNNKDRASKGRSAKQVPTRQCLTESDVANIRKRWVKGKAPKPNPNGTVAIAKDYGVDTAIIVKVIKGTYLCPSV